MAALLTIFLALCGASLPQTAQSTTPLTTADVVGHWIGSIEHDGTSTPIGLEIEQRGDAVRAVLLLGAIHGRLPLGSVKVSGTTVQTQAMPFEFDRAAGTLSAPVPGELVPRYQLRMTLRKSDTALAFAPRPDPPMPPRAPAWTIDLGAPLWADAAFDRDRVYAGADDGKLHAIDAKSGRTLWTFAAGGPIRARVTIAGSDVIFPSDNGMLHRLDAASGKVRWQVRIADKPAVRLALSDPNGRYDFRAGAVAVYRDRLFVGTYEGKIISLDAATGARLWEFKAGDSVATTPAIANGLVYVGSYDHFVYALNESTGALAWKYDTGEAVTSDVASAGDRVIVGSRSYDLESLDARTGAPQWKHYFWFSWVESSPNVAGDTIFVGSSDAAKVSAIDLATGKTRWQVDAFGSAWGRPAVTETTVFQGVAGVLRYLTPHRGVVLALDRQSGAVKWWFEAAPPVPRDPPPPELRAYGFAGSVAVGAGLVFAPGLDGRLYAFRQ